MVAVVDERSERYGKSSFKTLNNIIVEEKLYKKVK